MMIRSNSKKAIENIRMWVIDHADFSNYDGYEEAEKTRADGLAAWPAVKDAINEIFFDEEIRHDRRKLSGWEFFLEWTRGLPSVLDTCYWYNRDARDDLAPILEETPEEAMRFTDEAAGIMLTKLIFRELSKN